MLTMKGEYVFCQLSRLLTKSINNGIIIQIFVLKIVRKLQRFRQIAKNWRQITQNNKNLSKKKPTNCSKIVPNNLNST